MRQRWLTQIRLEHLIREWLAHTLTLGWDESHRRHCPNLINGFDCRISSLSGIAHEVVAARVASRILGGKCPNIGWQMASSLLFVLCSSLCAPLSWRTVFGQGKFISVVILAKLATSVTIDWIPVTKSLDDMWVIYLSPELLNRVLPVGFAFPLPLSTTFLHSPSEKSLNFTHQLYTGYSNRSYATHLLISSLETA